MSLGRDMVYALAAVLSAPVWAVRLWRTGKWRTDWRGRFGHAAVLEPKVGKRVLIHAVSVGEVNLVRQLVGQLAERGVEVVIATTTNTGFARARQLYGERHAVVRYPLDFTRAVRRFLDAVRPDAVALVELEVWPTFTQTCERRSIPVCVINGRLSDRGIRRYRLVKPLVRSTFARLAAVGAQTPAYAERFIEMGVAAERVKVLDNMKWDTAVLADAVPGAAELAAEMGVERGRPVVVLGSTGEGEEVALVEALLGAKPQAAGTGVQIIVVPRKPERFEEVARDLPGIRRRTKGGAGSGNLFLLDTLGELGKAYSLADVVIVGRSFNGWGGSDPIEAVALGKATIVGPDHQNFREVVAALRAGGGLLVSAKPQAAGAAAARLLGDAAAAAESARRGRAVIQSRQGATQRYVQMVVDLLEQGAASRVAS